MKQRAPSFAVGVAAACNQEWVVKTNQRYRSHHSAPGDAAVDVEVVAAAVGEAGEIDDEAVAAAVGEAGACTLQSQLKHAH